VKQAPEDSDKYYELGLAHSKLAQYAEAVRALEKALDIDPDFFRAAEALTRAREGLDRRQAFLKDLEKMRQKKPKSNANVNTNASAPAPTPPPSAP
jgi:tetratricopeptide (TPR) repeat protein